MKTLADKVHKQGEHIPQLSNISHNHPYISTCSSYMLAGTISIYSLLLLYVCKDGCAINVVECALLVCVFCQPVPLSGPAIPTFGTFLLEIS